MAAVVALGATGLGLVVQQRLDRGREGMWLEHTEGPFRATVRVDGTAELGAAFTALQRGEAFGWAGTLCTAPDTGMLMQARLVRLSDNAVLLYRERSLPADARGCSSAVWDIVLPADTPPGRYQVQRFVLLTPRAAPPFTRTLPPLSLDVRP